MRLYRIKTDSCQRDELKQQQVDPIWFMSFLKTRLPV